jgi:hypothetical protein
MSELPRMYTATPKIGDEDSVWWKHNRYYDAETQLHSIDTWFQESAPKEAPHTPTLDELEDLFRPIYEPKVAGAVKYDADKPDWSLVPMHVVEYIAKVMTFGAKKYARDGWKSLPDFENRYLAALLRHLVAYQNGEFTDPESGLPHLAHVLTNATFLLWKGLPK